MRMIKPHCAPHNSVIIANSYGICFRDGYQSFFQYSQTSCIRIDENAIPDCIVLIRSFLKTPETIVGSCSQLRGNGRLVDVLVAKNIVAGKIEFGTLGTEAKQCLGELPDWIGWDGNTLQKRIAPGNEHILWVVLLCQKPRYSPLVDLWVIEVGLGNSLGQLRCPHALGDFIV